MGKTKRKLAVRVKEHRADFDNTVSDRVYTQESRKQSENERNKSGGQKEIIFNLTWVRGFPQQCSFRIEYHI